MTAHMRRLISVTAVALFASVLVGTVRAQEPGSRAEEQARQQEEKSRHLAPYRTPWIERQLQAIEDAGGFGVARGLFVTFGDIKRGSGIALGPAYGKLFANGLSVVSKAAFSIRGYKVGQVALQSRGLASGRLRLSGRARWQDAPVVALYELVPDSPKVRTDYAETKTEVSAAALIRPVRPLRFTLGVGFERFDTEIASGRDPDNPIFISMPGAGADPRYVHGQASAAIDFRDGVGYSRHGTLVQAAFHDYRQQNSGPYSFQRVDGVAEQYVPILHGNWVLMFALRGSTTTADLGNQVPFFLLPDLGGHDLRGFANYRFRDRHSILATVEYRWYAQEFLDAAIFYDAGKAVPDRRSLDFDGLKSSIGGGIRFHTPQSTALRLEVTHSREGVRLIIAFSPVGQ
jgi:hypothetical protein